MDLVMTLCSTRKDSNLSLGEMSAEEKALLSHRGKAIQVLKRKIEGFASE